MPPTGQPSVGSMALWLSLERVLSIGRGFSQFRSHTSLHWNQQPITNKLEANKNPRQDLKWINLTVPSIGLMALNCAAPKSIMEADRKNVQARGLDLLVASPSQSS